jgi:hypothetical protein
MFYKFFSLIFWIALENDAILNYDKYYKDIFYIALCDRSIISKILFWRQEMFNYCICEKCGDAVEKGESYKIYYNCQKKGWMGECWLSTTTGFFLNPYRTSRCKLYDGPKYLCKKCRDEKSTISWLQTNSCPESKENTIEEDDLGIDDFMAIDPEEEIKDIEVERYKRLREGDMEVFNVYLDYLFLHRGTNYKYCIDELNKIIKNAPEYKKLIISELLKHEEKRIWKHNHEEEVTNLDYYILVIIDKNYPELTDEGEISEFIIKKCKSINQKTKKKSKKLFKKYRLNKCCIRKNGI